MRIFTTGRYLYCWNRAGDSDWKKFEPTPAFTQTLLQHDITDVIVHSVEPVPENNTEASEWAAPERVSLFNAAGIGVIIGIGCRAPTYWKQIAAAIIKAIDACKRSNSPCKGVNVDWEGSWDGHKAETSLMLQMILDAHADAGLWMTMPSWWAPEETPNGHATHPSAPTKEWLDVIDALVPIDPQCYGAPNEGASKGMLAWARSQYLKHYGLPAERVIPGVQLYHRSIFDHVDLLLGEVAISLWDWLEADAEALHALRIAKVLRSRPEGVSGPNWIAAFQTAYGLKADGIAGPLTKAALAAKVTA